MNNVKIRGYASLVWLGTLATIAIVGLLLAFHHVVRGAVQQGELRRKTTAAHAEATWRCNILRELDRCLVQQNALPQDGAPLQARDVATVADR